MAKVREIACKHYQYEGSCSLGKKNCSFYGRCQTCNKYLAKAGSKPNRPDLRRKKLEDVRKGE